MLNDLTAAIAAEHVNIHAIETRTDQGEQNAFILATIAVSSIRQLARLFTRIETVSGVSNITRVTS